MVDIGLNLDAGGYVTTMGQAINLTKQYSDVASGLPGTVQNMSKSMVGATMAVTGFNKINGVALDSAAAYEKQLSKIESKASITGQNFEKLSKTTKSFARDFPIGMGQATQVMETLQQQGIKSEKQMASLGKSFIKLGAATGTNAAEMGAEFLQLSRTFGNGVNQFGKLSDSLVTTTAKIGGSVPSVVAFSKSLAPVASTVGLSQTAVIGLSTAMSKLGEDGFQAANSFNKVLLDMNRAVRDGGPELKAYADLMGTTSERLKEMFKTNPSEVLAQFSESVAKTGPNVTRTLDALGFDSVRTTRSLTALARSGGPREAIDTAISSYGDGSTERASEIALDGLTDSATKLQETMGQVVQDVGQPLLGFAKGALAPANAVAGAIQSATSSTPGQAIFGAAGLGGAAAGVVGTGVTVMTVASVAAMAMKAVNNTDFVKNYKAGKAAGAAGFPAAPTRAGYGAQAGFARGVGAASVFGSGATEGAGARMGALGNRLGGIAMESGARYNAATSNMMRAVMPWMPRTGITPEMAAGREGIKDSTRALANSARNLDGGGVRAAGGTLARQIGAYARTYDVGAARGAANLVGQSAGLAVRAGAGVGSLALNAGSRVMSGLGSMGISPAMLGIGAAVGGGIYLSSQQKKTDANVTRMGEANSDIYLRFNDFAEATGKAGKGLVALTESVTNTTKSLVESNTTWKQAFDVTPQEVSQSRTAGYDSATSIFGDDKSASALTFFAQTTLGTTATMEDVARVMFDVSNLAGGNVIKIQEVGRNLSQIYGPDAKAGGKQFKAEDLYELLKSNSSNVMPWVNDAQTEIGISAAASISREGYEAAQLYGGTISGKGVTVDTQQATQLLRAEEYFNAAKDDLFANESTSKASAATLASILGVSPDDLGMPVGLVDDPKMGAYGSDTELKDVLDDLAQTGNEDQKELAIRLGKQLEVLNQNGVKIDNGAINYGSGLMSAKNAAQIESEKYLASVSTTMGATSEFGNVVTELTKEMFSVTNATIKAGKAMENLSSSDIAAVGGNFAMAQAVQDSGDAKKVQFAVDSITKQVVKSAGGNYGEAKLGLQLVGSQAGTTSTERQIFEAAMGQVSSREGIHTAGMSNAERNLRVYQTGELARNMPRTSTTTPIINQAIMASETAQGTSQEQMAQMVKSYGAMQTNIRATQRSAGVNIGQITRQTEIGLERAGDDYKLNKRYQKEDFALSQSRGKRDFDKGNERAVLQQNTTLERSQTDYDKNRTRAIADSNKQKQRSTDDFNLSMTRATDDYNKGTLRANRDFNLSMSRADRDFQIGQVRGAEDYQRNQLRATIDFNKSRTRMMSDYDKQITRLSEDSARSMYDPFKRIQAQMVMDGGQLVSNLKDQTEAIQKQMGNLSQARSMGLSNETIKALNLSDASNAQQLSRIVGDLAGNSDLASQINEAVSSKAVSSSELMQDAGNTQFQRMAEDFNLQMTRASEDFATAAIRASEDFTLQVLRSMADFSTSISDATTDFRTQLSDADVDFKLSTQRMTVDFKTASERMAADFKLSLDIMEFDFKEMTARSKADFALQMGYALADFKISVNDANYDFSKMRERAKAAFKLATDRMAEDAALAIAGIGAQTAAAITSMEEAFFGMGQNSATGLAAAKEFLAMIASSKIDVSEMSDEFQNMVKAALAFTTSSGLSLSIADRLDPIKEPSKAGTFDESMKPSMNDSATKAMLAKASEAVGTSTGEGFQLGIETQIDAWWTNYWNSVINDAKQEFGIESPSTVFKTIGEYVAEGFEDGVETISPSLWDKLTDTLPSVTKLKSSVVGAFDDAKEWLQSFNSEESPVQKWIGLGWNKIWADVPLAENVKNKVVKAFVGDDGEGGIKGWLKALKGDDENASVMGWVGNAWSRILENIPGLETVKTSFSPMVRGIIDVVNEIIKAWNKIQIKIDIPPFFQGKFGVPDAESVSIGTKYVNPVDYPFALGGIATRQMNALIGEAGYPEAVIPLNARGAEVLAATMARYVQGSDVQASGMERYASPVTNYYSNNQDYSTQFNGQITVNAQNPDEFAARLAARARRQALSQPIRGQR